MAMAPCTHCGAEISSDAKICPKCGGPQRRTKRSTKLAAVAIGLGVIMTMYLNSQGEDRRAAVEAAKTPEQRASEAAAKAQAEADFQRAALAARALKRSAKNPESFQLDSARITDAGALCMSYRATNSFNAVVPGYAVIPNTGKASTGPMSEVLKAWEKHCDKKPGRDVSHVRHAL